MPVDHSTLLDTVASLARRAGLDPFQLVTAQTLAWYYATRYEQRYGNSDPLPASHWARLAVRATGSCTVTTSAGTVQGIHIRSCRPLQRAGGSSYQKGGAAIPPRA